MILWSKLSLFWKCQIVGWAAFVSATFPLKIELTGSISGALFLCLIRDGSSFLLTVALRMIYRKNWSNEGLRMAMLIVVLCTLGGLLQAGFAFLFRNMAPIAGEIPLTHSTAFNTFYERTGLLFAWSSLYFGIRHAVEGIQRDLRLSLIESKRRQAELQMLRAQMNPHFLFNALNTIRAGVGVANPVLGGMVQSLADFLRFSLDHSNDDFIPLGLEFDAMRDYLAVEKTRFRHKLEFHCEIDEAMRVVPVPGIILQPLVENAVKYGQDTSDFLLCVSVNISRPAVDRVQIIVSNTGHWLEPMSRDKSGHLGLQNLRNRLELLYPGKHRLDITHPDGRVTITIQIPIL